MTYAFAGHNCVKPESTMFKFGFLTLSSNIYCQWTLFGCVPIVNLWTIWKTRSRAEMTVALQEPSKGLLLAALKIAWPFI